VLDAILEKNQIDPAKLTITNIGFDMTPLTTGQVDAVTGWITNTQALSIIGPDRIDLMMKTPACPPTPTSISRPTTRRPSSEDMPR
jgi:NitT/TauT family transport system substrate-binding protein